jgi:hypothetical protein
LAETSDITPKAGGDWVEQLPILRVARRSAIQARTQTINQMYALVVGAPADLRDHLHRLSRHQLISQAARFRVGQATTCDPWRVGRCASSPNGTGLLLPRLRRSTAWCHR